MKHKFVSLIVSLMMIIGFSHAETTNDNKSILFIEHKNALITIDGIAQQKEWQGLTWTKLDKHILGEMPSPEDFQGRFKLAWDENYLYILAEIVDDVLFDQYANPLERYWDDDCLEAFIDEDASGGDHLYNFNAFAYHIALDNQSVDIGTKNSQGIPQVLLLNDHVKSAWRRNVKSPNKIIWEVAIKLFDDKYQPFLLGNKPVKLVKGKHIGFMLAYCDNDGSANREHFIGSTIIDPINGDKNLGYKTADVFQKYQLK